MKIFLIEAQYSSILNDMYNTSYKKRKKGWKMSKQLYVKMFLIMYNNNGEN